MSYLSGFRINFAGGFYTNVDTANNDDVIAQGTDPLNGMLLPPFDQMSDDDVRATFMKVSTDPNAGGQINGGWNYMGDHETRLMNAEVTSWGAPGSVSDAGSIIGKSVYLLGNKGQGAPVMVDLDPTGGGVATQIFLGGIQIGDGDNALRIFHDTVGYTYFMGPRFAGVPRNPSFAGFAGQGVWFQFGIPKAALPARAADSEMLQLLDAAREAKGLLVRISPFEVTASMTDDVLAKLFSQGQPQKNPAIGYVVGTIGVWNHGELATSPAGRILSDPTKPRARCSVALAHVDPTTGFLSFDLVQAIPKAAFRALATDVSAIGPNFDIGQLSVKTDGSQNPIATFTPDPVNYWRYGGIVDVHVGRAGAQSLLGKGISVIDSSGKFNWIEEPYRVESDERGVYFNDPTGRQTVSLRVTEYGRPPTQPVTLQFGTDSSGSLPDPGNLVFQVNGKAAKSIVVPEGTVYRSVIVRTNGQPGMSQMSVVATGAFGQSNNGTFQALFRVFPVDDFSEVIATGKIPWILVYSQVLRYYYIIFPAMSQRLPLNRPDLLTTPMIAKEIQDRMDDRLFLTTKYMPITRSLSAGKKKLLFAFLKQGPLPAA